MEKLFENMLLIFEYKKIRFEKNEQLFLEFVCLDYSPTLMERIIKESLNKKYSKKTRKNLDKILEETNSLMKT